jgi:3'(2'), 5'-bisphosphate nucleotidase
MPLSGLADILVSLSKEAGAEIMRVYATDFDARAKDDDSPVTEADLAADRVIVAGLERAFPDIPIVTEERADSHDVAAAGNRFFLVDPLDGTKEFVKRGGDFTVNIALIEDGVPVRGVVYAPAQDRLFWTDDDGGAWLKDGDGDALGDARAMRVATPDNAALNVVASKSHRDAATDDYINRYAVADFKSAGSSLKFCLLAAGEADLYPRLGRTMEWDTAAGHAVLRAAGGVVDAWPGATSLTYGKPGFENPHFIAYSTGVILKDAT